MGGDPGNGTAPFDTVWVQDSGVEQPLGVAAFMDLPLATRIRLILQRRLRFTARGSPYDTTAALKALRELGRPAQRA